MIQIEGLLSSAGINYFVIAVSNGAVNFVYLAFRSLIKADNMVAIIFHSIQSGNFHAVHNYFFF